jgi:hypothetical protein
VRRTQLANVVFSILLCICINNNDNLTEIQVMADTEFPKDVTLDNEQVSLLLKQANQSSLGDQFGTILL